MKLELKEPVPVPCNSAATKLLSVVNPLSALVKNCSGSPQILYSWSYRVPCGTPLFGSMIILVPVVEYVLGLPANIFASSIMSCIIVRRNDWFGVLLPAFGTKIDLVLNAATMLK